MSSVEQKTEVSERALAGWEIVSIVSSLAIAEWIVFSFAGASKAISITGRSRAVAVFTYLRP